MMKKIVILLVLAFFCGCRAEAEKIPMEINHKSLVYFCPQDDCENHLVEFINSSQTYVHCAFFDLDLSNVINILARKSKNIDVKVVIDNENYDGQIKGNVKVDTNKQFSHNKFCVIDGKAVLTGSFNPTESESKFNNNNVIIFYSAYLAKNYEDEFQELWNGQFGSGNPVSYPIIFLNNKTVENYFCPEDGCSKRAIENIIKAKKSIYFMTFSFTHEQIADAILFSNATDIKGVFDKTQAGSQYSQYKRLKGFGLNVRLDNNKRTMHHKVFIIDNETVITGSFNPTENGDTRNDENIVIIHDKEIAKKFVKEFGKVFGG